MPNNVEFYFIWLSFQLISMCSAEFFQFYAMLSLISYRYLPCFYQCYILVSTLCLKKVPTFKRFPAVQTSRKSVKISQSYSEFKGGNFFWDTVYFVFIKCGCQCQFERCYAVIQRYPYTVLVWNGANKNDDVDDDRLFFHVCCYFQMV